MNKKICFLIVFCLLFVGLMARADSDQSVVVLEPNGGEVWEAGKTYRVVWQATGLDTFAAAVVCGNDIVLSRYNIKGNSYLFNLSSAQVSYSRCKAVVAKSDIGDFDNIELGVDGDYSDANFKIAGTGTAVSGVQSIEEYLKSQTDLIKGPDGKMYELINGYRLWLPGNVFSVLGYNSADAVSLTWTEVNEYPRLKLAEMSGSVFVYYLTEGGRKRLIPNSEVFDSYYNNWDDVVELEESILNVFPDVELIRGEGDYKVYKLENGAKRWIKTAEVFNQMGYSWSNIAPVNKIELDTYSEGAVIGGEGEEDTEEEDIVEDTEEVGTEITRDVRRVTDMRQLAMALEMYYDDNGTFPVNLSDMVTDMIITHISLDPSTNENYNYIQLSSGEEYHLGGELEISSSPFLDGDADYDSSEEGGFDGADPVYDIIP